MFDSLGAAGSKIGSKIGSVPINVISSENISSRSALVTGNNIREKFLSFRNKSYGGYCRDKDTILRTELRENHRCLAFSLRIFSTLLIMNRSLLIIAGNCN